MGSLLGMYLGLKGMGKEAVPYLEDQLPPLYDFLPGSKDIVHTLDGVKDIDCTIAVDCGQADRLGDNFSSFKRRGHFLEYRPSRDERQLRGRKPRGAGGSAAGEIVYDVLKARGSGDYEGHSDKPLYRHTYGYGFFQIQLLDSGGVQKGRRARKGRG